MSTAVTLDHHEALESAIEGLKRRHRRLYEGIPERYGTFDGDLWGADIEATCAEAAFAKFMGLYWRPSEGPQQGDVRDVQGWEVRWSKHDQAHLLVHERDADHAPYVLVVGALPHFRITGYMVGKQAKDARYWRDSERPCFRVPQRDLRTLTGDEGRWPEGGA